MYPYFGKKIEAFCDTPGRSQVGTDMTGTKTFKKNPTAAEIASGVIDITGWIMMKINPRTDSSFYFGTDSTKLHPAPADCETEIMLFQSTMEQVVVQFGTACTVNSVRGM